MPIVLRGSKGAVAERDFDALVELACRHGWSEMDVSVVRAVRPLTA